MPCNLHLTAVTIFLCKLSQKYGSSRLKLGNSSMLVHFTDGMSCKLHFVNLKMQVFRDIRRAFSVN